MSYQRFELATANGTSFPSTVNRLSFGGGFVAIASSGTVALTLDANTVSSYANANGSFRQMFTASNFDANGVLVITHNLGEDFPFVQIYSNAREVIMPDGIVSIDANNIRITMSSYGNIIGNWTIAVRK